MKTEKRYGKMEQTCMDYLMYDKENPCIWMQAGVVERKLCKREYQCSTCRFDRAMRRTADENDRLRKQGIIRPGKRGNIVFWKEKLKNLPAWNRPCIHNMKKRIDFRACSNEYRCGNCEFDQYFQDQYTVHAVVQPVDVLDIDGFKIPHGFYLHHGHAWARIEEDSSVRIGLDDFALRLLGPLDRIKAPLLGKEIKQDRADILLNRDDNQAKLLSPVSGVVTAVNSVLRKQGSLANQAPYSDGWVLRIHSNTLRRDLKNLMIGNETRDFLSKEVDQLYSVIEKEEPLAADGGQLGPDIFGSMPGVEWKMLTGLFLHT